MPCGNVSGSCSRGPEDVTLKLLSDILMPWSYQFFFFFSFLAGRKRLHMTLHGWYCSISYKNNYDFHDRRRSTLRESSTSSCRQNETRLEAHVVHSIVTDLKNAFRIGSDVLVFYRLLFVILYTLFVRFAFQKCLPNSEIFLKPHCRKYILRGLKAPCALCTGT